MEYSLYARHGTCLNSFDLTGTQHEKNYHCFASLQKLGDLPHRGHGKEVAGTRYEV